jgi:hypothetical protein
MTMNLNPDRFLAARERYLPLLDRLAALFEQMDATYDAVAGQYGFQCHGCEDNCCQTRFYHHTLIEYLFLMEGINALDAGRANGKYDCMPDRSAMENGCRRGSSGKVLSRDVPAESG